MSTGHSFNYHDNMTSPQDFEHDVTITDADAGDPATVRLLIAKVGGGTPGRAYTGAWYYRLDVNGETAAHGDDLETGTPKTHAQTARIAAEFLASGFPEADAAEALETFAETGQQSPGAAALRVGKAGLEAGT